MAHEPRTAAAPRRGRAFLEGVAVGLASPGWLMSGAFAAPLKVRRNTLEDAWDRVGQCLQQGLDQHELDQADSDLVDERAG